MEEEVSEEKLALWYRDFINDLGVDEIDKIARIPNIFSVLKVERLEIRHSNFLAWIIDPNESHQLGDIFLKRFLQKLVFDHRSTEISIFDTTNLDTEKIEVRREWLNIDLLVLTENFLVCIENKVWAPETGGQLKKYFTELQNKFPNVKKLFVYLSPDARASSMNDQYINIGYEDIVDILDTLLEHDMVSMDNRTRLYIEDYNVILKRNFMNKDEAVEHAQRVYLNHKNLFDFVLRHRPNTQEIFGKILTDKVKSNGEWLLASGGDIGLVRFLSGTLDPLILRYPNKNGWKNREAFVYEFDFRSGTTLKFRTVIGPEAGNEKYYNLLDRRMTEIKEVDPWNERWKVHLSADLDWDLDLIFTEELSFTKEKELNAFFESAVLSIVKKTDKHLKKYSEELKAAKSLTK